MNKLLGYRYTIHEMYPVKDGDGISKPILSYDRIELAQDVLDALHRNDINFTVYVIMAEPVYSSKASA